MGDSDFNIATLELTKEILEELGIPELVSKQQGQGTQAQYRIDEYAKYFRRLRAGLTAPTDE